MKLSDWFTETKREKGEFAEAIGVTPQMISAYCKGSVWPSKKRMKMIAAETAGAVTPNDFIECSEDEECD